MSSIGSTINSINTSLLSEISSYLKTSTTSSSAATDTTTASSTSTDQIDFSQVAELFKELQQLQKSNPDELKQVLTEAAEKFKDAASQTTDTRDKQFLTNLSDRFQQAADTGDLSVLGPQGLGQRSARQLRPPSGPASRSPAGCRQRY